MTDANKAKDEVLDALANDYSGSEYLAAVDAVERMHHRWRHHG